MLMVLECLHYCVCTMFQTLTSARASNILRHPTRVTTSIKSYKRTHKFKYYKMSATNRKGRLDPASVLDDDYNPDLLQKGHRATTHVVADVTPSDGTLFPIYKPFRQVNTFAGGYTSLPDPRQDSAAHSVASAGFPPDCAYTTANRPEPLNMQLHNTIVSQRLMVKDCVKNKLFRRLNVFKKDVHGLYDLRNGTVCAMIVANCNVTKAEASEHWWADMRKLVVCTHTDRRNNVIKNMHLRFKGT